MAKEKKDNRELRELLTGGARRNDHIYLRTITGIVPSFFFSRYLNEPPVCGSKGPVQEAIQSGLEEGADPRLSEGQGQKVASPVMKVSLNQNLLNTNHSLLNIRFKVSYAHMPESAHVGRVRYFIKNGKQ